jgi:hypothetical protein
MGRQAHKPDSRTRQLVSALALNAVSQERIAAHTLRKSYRRELDLAVRGAGIVARTTQSPARRGGRYPPAARVRTPTKRIEGLVTASQIPAASAASFFCLRSRVEDGRGGLGHAATLRFPSPLIKPDVRISRIRLSDWLHRKAHAGDLSRPRQRHSTRSSA